MKKISMALALAGVFCAAKVSALSLDDIRFWTGTGTNRAALVIHWSAPEVRNNTRVRNPAADKSLVWGYRWDGTKTAEDMFNAVVAADHRLFVAASAPYPGYGPFIYSIGYDLNNNGVFGTRAGTNVYAENAFVNGQRVVVTEDADGAESLDAGDLFWSGLYGANWEMWQERGGAGGFTNAPDRGADAYWTPGDTKYFSYGAHGQWDCTSGLELVTLKDGSWVGFTVAAGGLNYMDPNDPGTMAYDYHKHAPEGPEGASTNSAHAVEIIAAQGPFGVSPYNDTNCVLGAPTTRFYESATQPATRVKLVEGAYGYAPDRTNKLILTLNAGSSIIARFSQPVYDNPANPYGVDFEVFGNTFFVGSGYPSDEGDLTACVLSGAAFAESTKVSVSPGYVGRAGEDANDPATWAWYRYENGPYGDSVFPTQAYRWDRTGASWTEELQDFTKPVNPVLKGRFSEGNLTAADGVELYAGSGGGTGFDLKESGFAWIRYVKVEGMSGYSGGEIDAFSVVRPMTIGDGLSIAPGNVTNGTGRVLFQRPGAEDETVLWLEFAEVSDIGLIKTERLDDDARLGSVIGTPVNAVQLGLGGILDTNGIAFRTDVGLSAGVNYSGTGKDLRVAQWTGTNWQAQAFVFNPTNKSVVVEGVTNLTAFVVSQIVPPQLAARSGTNGFGCWFVPVANCAQTLERSTNLVTWTPVVTITATNSTPVTLTDTNAMGDNVFYRVQVNVP